MIHRYIYEMLTVGIQNIKNNPKLLDDLFVRDFCLEAEELGTIKTYFASKGLTVVNGYARQDTAFPAVAITLGSEREAEAVMGDSGGQILDETDSLWGADILASVWEYTYNLLIYTQHPDVTAYYYEIVKSILLSGIPYLIDELNLFRFTVRGTELAPDPAYMPEHLFGRQLTFMCQKEFQLIDRDSLLSKAFQVTGIHIDNPGYASDINDGIRKLVTPYSEE